MELIAWEKEDGFDFLEKRQPLYLALVEAWASKFP